MGTGEARFAPRCVPNTVRTNEAKNTARSTPQNSVSSRPYDSKPSPSTTDMNKSFVSSTINSEARMVRGSRCRVDVAWAAKEMNELTVQEGDVVNVCNIAGNWVYVSVIREYPPYRGWLPQDILEIVE